MAVSSSKELISLLKNNKSLLKREFGVNRLGIFGSFAWGSIHAKSDIDIVVELDKKRKTLHNFMQLKRYLEQQTEREIDLGFEQSLKPIVRKSIKSQIIYV